MLYTRQMLKAQIFFFLTFCPDSIMGYFCIMIICTEQWTRHHLCLITLGIWKVDLGIIFAIILGDVLCFELHLDLYKAFYSFLTLINSIRWFIYALLIISHFKKRECITKEEYVCGTGLNIDEHTMEYVLPTNSRAS